MSRLVKFSGAVAALLLVVWLMSAFVVMVKVGAGPFQIGIVRSGFALGYHTPDATPGVASGDVELSYSSGAWFYWPQIVDWGFLLEIIVPHWLINLVAWTGFLLLRRRSQRHHDGHCRNCGYDLTLNASGVCPECNTGVS